MSQCEAWLIYDIDLFKVDLREEERKEKWERLKGLIQIFSKWSKLILNDRSISLEVAEESAPPYRP